MRFGFRQLRTCRLTRPGEPWVSTRSPASLIDHASARATRPAEISRPRLFAVFRLITDSKRDRRIWEMLLFLVHFQFGSMHKWPIITLHSQRDHRR